MCVKRVVCVHAISVYVTHTCGRRVDVPYAQCPPHPAGKWSKFGQDNAYNLLPCVDVVKSCPPGEFPYHHGTICMGCGADQFKQGTNLGTCAPIIGTCEDGFEPDLDGADAYLSSKWCKLRYGCPTRCRECPAGKWRLKEYYNLAGKWSDKLDDPFADQKCR